MNPCGPGSVLANAPSGKCWVWYALLSVPHPGCRIMKKSGSDDDVFSAVGGMELGRHDAASSTAAAAQVMAQASALGPGAATEGGAALHSPAQTGLEPQHAGSNPFSAPAIGDLPFSETPSRTLIVRNVAASRSDQDLQHLFEVSTCCRQPGIPDNVPISTPLPCDTSMQRTQHQPVDGLDLARARTRLQSTQLLCSSACCGMLRRRSEQCLSSQAFGEIRSLYTACKQRGLVTVNYFDLRAACLALHSLAGTALGDATLDVQYPVPSEQTVVDREDVRADCGCSTIMRSQHRLVETFTMSA